VFEGGGFGVGLTVHPVGPALAPAEPLPSGMSSHPSRLSELMPTSSRSDRELAAELQRAFRAEDQLWAYRVRMVVDLAARRPACRDRLGKPGAAAPGWRESCWALEGVSEFLPDELRMTLNCSRGEATRLAQVALVLDRWLPHTWAALADGDLSWPRARAMAQEVLRSGPDLDPRVIATVEAVVLPQAEDKSIRELRALMRAEIIRRDQDAADRRRKQAEQTANVRLRAADDDGMAEVIGTLPQPLAAAVVATVDAIARALKTQGDQRPLGQLRAAVLARLVLRPGADGLPAVRGRLHLLAPLRGLLADPADPESGGPPTGIGTVDGEAVTAAHLRAVLTALGAIGGDGLTAPAGGELFVDLLGGAGQLLASLTVSEMEAALRRGCPTHPDQPDQPTRDCGCPLVTKPPATDAYQPTDGQRRFVTTRDRGCRIPGCPGHAGWADLDHNLPHAQGGATDCDNLCCLCRFHHRLKTHAPGWTFTLDDDGALIVTTPSGVTRISRPPGSDLLEPFEFGEQLPDTDDPDPAPF
jgi:hypothetical protein